jgi:phage shock protein E
MASVTSKFQLGHRKVGAFMSFLSGFFGSKKGPRFSDVSQFIVIDVRTPAEFSETHVKGSLNIDFMNQNFKEKISALDKSKIYKVYCRSGNRSGQAEKIMKNLGFQDVENLGSVDEASTALGIPCE